jgi:diguanylate cyclase (GGDEF)-like protein
MMLAQILAPDYELLTESSGEAALKLIAEKKPDLILLDVIMPGMSGFEVLTELKSNPYTGNIPVIFITGLDNEQDEERGFLLGAVDYITKPFKSVIVKVRVNTHMQIVRQIRLNERLGMMDSLTEIPNRRSFDNRIDMEWRRAMRERQAISFLMMDVDKFKTYNDTYGHLQGDILLKTVAKIFTASARRPPDLAARLGGEEFGVLLPGTDLPGALHKAEEIRQKVEATRIPTVDGAKMTGVTISIGVAATVPTPDDPAEKLVARADEYLYAAKAAGRNRVVSGPV